MHGRIHRIPDSGGNPRWTVHYRINVDGVRTMRARTFTDRPAAEAFVRQLSRDARNLALARERIVIAPRDKQAEGDGPSTTPPA